MSQFPYTTHQVQAFLDGDKCLPEGKELVLEKSGEGRIFDTRPELKDGPFVDMRYLGKAPILDDQATYDASFLIANRRVRGVGFNEVGRHSYRFKRHIPKGWHQNICDPTLPTDDPKQNIHAPMEDFSVSDFRDFVNQTADLWQIDLGWQWEAELW